jgi:predicted dehydrogenase
MDIGRHTPIATTQRSSPWLIERKNGTARESRQELRHLQRWQELAAGSELDFVDICTPPALHGEADARCAREGWNVLCEKPLLLELVELEKVRSLARSPDEQSCRSIIGNMH